LEEYFSGARLASSIKIINRAEDCALKIHTCTTARDVCVESPTGVTRYYYYYFSRVRRSFRLFTKLSLTVQTSRTRRERKPTRLENRCFTSSAYDSRTFTGRSSTICKIGSVARAIAPSSAKGVVLRDASSSHVRVRTKCRDRFSHGSSHGLWSDARGQHGILRVRRDDATTNQLSETRSIPSRHENGFRGVVRSAFSPPRHRLGPVRLGNASRTHRPSLEGFVVFIVNPRVDRGGGGGGGKRGRGGEE